MEKIIFTIFLLFGCLTNYAQQEILISEEFSNQRVSQVLDLVSKKYAVDFAFDSFQLGQIKGSWKFEDVSIETFLQELLESSSFSFKVLDNTYLIYEVIASEGASQSEPSAVESYSLAGEVRDLYSHELLPFTVLSIPNTFSAATADAEGHFVLNNLQDSNDTLEVFFVGYEIKLIPVKEILNKSYLRIYLTQTRHYLPDVLVTAEGNRFVSVGHIPGLQVVNPGSMNLLNATGEADVMRAAQILPGINATQETSNGLYIRGSNNDQTQISIDGFNLYHQDHFFGAFTAINANAVKVMNIHKGITESRFGGRVAGVVEIIGKEGNLRKTSAQIDIGPLAVGAVVEAPTDSLGKSSVFISARRAYTNVIFSPTYRNLFNTTYNAAVVTSPNAKTETFGSNDPEFYFQDFNFKFSYRPTTKDFVNLSLYSSRDQLYVQYADSSDKELENPLNVNYTDENYKKNAGAAIRWGRQWENDWNSLMVVGLSRFTGNFFSADSIKDLLFQTDSVRFTSELTLLEDVDGRFELSKNFSGHHFITGLQINSISSFIKKNEMGRIMSDTISRGTVISAYIGEENQTNDRLKLKPGIRINYFSRTSLFYFEPRLLLQFEVVKNVFNLKASAGRVHQYIQRTQTQSLYLNTPDYWWIADADGQGILQSDQLMFGFLFRKRHWTFDVESYYKLTEGNIFSNTLPGMGERFADAPLLSGTGRAYGADFLLSKDFKRHHLILSYSLMKTSVDYYRTQLKDIPEVFDQRHELKINYQLNLKSWDFSLFWVFGSGRPYTPLLGTYDFNLPDGETRKLPVYGQPNSARLPQYHRLDLSVAYHFVLGRTKFQVQASVFNVYDRVNIRDIQYLTQRLSSDPNDFSVSQRSLRMLGFLPSVNLKLNF